MDLPDEHASLESLDVLYHDEHILAVNKPHGLLVHPSSIARNTSVFAIDILEKQLNLKVFPLHRLDRKTSGVLLFAKSSKSAKKMQELLLKHELLKRYEAIVRGHFPETILVDHALTNDKGKVQEAITDFNCLKQSEISVPFGKHNTSRYSWIEIFPKTGRMHQIRKHCQHLRHPIIGDRPHGCNKQNRLFKEKWQMTRTLLHAQSVIFTHPWTNKLLKIEAKPSSEFSRMLKTLEFIRE